ncbi:MAG: hypothetical protein FK733_08395 [Asgard group archaeon]|nr:hypothetical protein [Asgard group archaeon]
MSKEAELKKTYFQRLRDAGYNTVPELVQILPPTIMNIIGSSIATAEKLFLSAIKTHMLNIQKHFDGDAPEGVNKALTDFGYMTIQEISEANSNVIAKTLQISLEHAGEIVLYAMELSVKGEEVLELKDRELMIEDLDREVTHYLDQLDRVKDEKKLDVIVEETVQKIHDTIKLPSDEIIISREKFNDIQKTIEQFMTVFPSCTGFSMYNKRGEGIYNYAIDKQAKNTLARIHETLTSIFWKISLALEEKNEYGWITAKPHLAWIEAIRDRSQKRQLAYIGLFIFEASSQDGVGNATLTTKGIIKEIERIIYESVQK